MKVVARDVTHFDSLLVDPMHLVKDVIEHITKFITGTGDSYKVCNEEKHRGRFRTAWVDEGETKKLPSAPFVSRQKDIVIANQRAENVLVPSSFDWRPRAFFSKPSSMKAHEWKQVVTSGILKFCLRGLLGMKQRQTLFKLFDVITRLCAEEIKMDVIENLEVDVHRALACFERDFPVSLQLIVFHLLHHLPRYVKLYGPVYGFWMFPYERFNSWISR